MADSLYHPYLQGYRFLIVGHTDARGSRESNLKLSEQRADAIREALINPFGISPSRIESVGLGEEQLLKPADPESGGEPPRAADQRRPGALNRGRLAAFAPVGVPVSALSRARGRVLKSRAMTNLTRRYRARRLASLAAAPAFAQTYPQPPDHADRAVGGGRIDRHPGARHRPASAPVDGPADRDREPHRRVRQHRHRRGRARARRTATPSCSTP